MFNFGSGRNCFFDWPTSCQLKRCGRVVVRVNRRKTQTARVINKSGAVGFFPGVGGADSPLMGNHRTLRGTKEKRGHRMGGLAVGAEREERCGTVGMRKCQTDLITKRIRRVEKSGGLSESVFVIGAALVPPTSLQPGRLKY